MKINPTFQSDQYDTYWAGSEIKNALTTKILSADDFAVNQPIEIGIIVEKGKKFIMIGQVNTEVVFDFEKIDEVIEKLIEAKNFNG